ncbi:MAG: capsule assembly Wzi family protein [bacterium]|nr:capsule assembly Wzi family protein [bacterium]
MYDTVNTARLKVNIFYENEYFGLFLQPVFKVGKDSSHPRKFFKDIVAGDYERAYIKLSPGNFDLLIGRERVALGPSPYDNLLLSGKGIPLDIIMGSYESHFFKLSMLFSRLEDIYDKKVDFVGDTTTYKTNQFRYITIKRVDFSLKDLLEWAGLDFPRFVDAMSCSFSDVCVFGGKYVFPDFYYLNPLTLGYLHQWTRGDDSNTLWCLDGRIDFRGLSLYAQWLIDDYQYSEDPNAEPNHTGWNLGVQVADPLGLERTFFGFEYTRVSRWTYTYFRPIGRYNYDGLPLGHPDGPGFDKISFRTVYHLNRSWDIIGRFSYRRKGETDIGTLWPIPEMPKVPGTFFPDNNFLSGVIEKSTDLRLGVRFFNLPRLTTEVLVGYTFINNYHHIANETKWFPSVRVGVGLIK